MPQVLYKYILTSLNRVPYVPYSCWTLCDLNSWSGPMFWTSVGNPATFKAELPAQESFHKSRLCQMWGRNTSKKHLRVKKYSLKSIALTVATQKQRTWQTVKKQSNEQMGSTVKTSEEIRNPKGSPKNKSGVFKHGVKKFDSLKCKTFFETIPVTSWNVREK